MGNKFTVKKRVDKSTGSKSKVDCPICLSTIEKKCRLDSCGHEFCRKCLLRWTDSQRTCPVCRQLFTKICDEFGADIHKDIHRETIRRVERSIKDDNIYIQYLYDKRQQKKKLLKLLVNKDENNSYQKKELKTLLRSKMMADINAKYGNYVIPFVD